jgi:hypothetical protein
VPLVPEALGSPVDWAREDGEGPFEDRARLLAEFWSMERFSPQMRLEGLASLALGELTGDVMVAGRCRAWLEQRLPAWEQRRERLTEQAGQALARLEREQARLTFERRWNRRDAIDQEVARLRGRLESARLRLQRHHDSLRPRPHEVARLLEGRVNRPQSRLRFERLRCEAAVLEDRVRRRAVGLADAEVDAVEVEVGRFLAGRPLSPRSHGLSGQQRQRRRARLAAWQDQGWEILRRARAMLARRRAARTESERRAVLWLTDVIHLFEFALLDTVGVIGGLRRPEWQVECLLRAE